MHVEFALDKVALGQVFSKCFGFPLSVSAYTYFILTFNSANTDNSKISANDSIIKSNTHLSGLKRKVLKPICEYENNNFCHYLH
jgi:hypothetical protein